MKYYEVLFKKNGSGLAYRKAVSADSLDHALEVVEFELRDVGEGFVIERIDELEYADYENFGRATVTRNVYQAD